MYITVTYKWSLEPLRILQVIQVQCCSVILQFLCGSAPAQFYSSRGWNDETIWHSWHVRSTCSLSHLLAAVSSRSN